MKADDKNAVAGAVLRRRHQVVDVAESRLAREIIRHVVVVDLFDRVDDNVTLVHAIAAANLHMRLLPDADTATDTPPADAFA